MVTNNEKANMDLVAFLLTVIERWIFLQNTLHELMLESIKSICNTYLLLVSIMKEYRPLCELKPGSYCPDLGTRFCPDSCKTRSGPFHEGPSRIVKTGPARKIYIKCLCQANTPTFVRFLQGFFTILT